MATRIPDLTQSLSGHDLGQLRIVAEMWGIELSCSDARSALTELVTLLLDTVKQEDIVTLLPLNANTVLNELILNGGRIPWAQFTRSFGIVREMGAGRRDREQPQRNPASPAEILWYRALLGRAFFDTTTGPEEFAYIPADIMSMLPMIRGINKRSYGHPAYSADYAYPIIATDQILDDSCTLLAAQRMGLSSFYSINLLPESSGFKKNKQQSPLPPLSSSSQLRYPPPTLKQLLAACGLLDSSGIPFPEATRTFLEANRGDALLQLVSGWLHSQIFNELCLIPGLRCEGEWVNEPERTRQVVIDFLSNVPDNTWWNLNAFLDDIKQHTPDFQRPAGDYDSWFIKDENTDEYLRGFSNWDRVDGKLIQYIITGPMYWLGLIDLAAPTANDPVRSFRHSPWSVMLRKGIALEGLPAEDGKIFIKSNAHLRVPRFTPRSVRYQIARFCLWEEEMDNAYQYRLTPESLSQARLQGLRINQLLALFSRYATSVPPTLVKALERWEEFGVEAQFKKMLVLRVKTPELLKELRHSRAERFLGDPLGTTTIEVKPGAMDKVQGVLAEMGYLGEWVVEIE